MSFDEILIFLKAHEEKEHKEWEKLRWNWFYTVIAQRGNEDYKTPEKLHRFPWEIKEVKKRKPLTKAQIDRKKKQAEKYLNGRKK